MASSTVTITRNSTSQLSNSLTVNFTVAGTAVFGTDYTVSGANTFTTTVGSIIIHANQTQASLVITTVADAVVEPNETIIITINPTAGVSTGTGSITYTITNDDVASPTVMLLHFDGANNSSVIIDSSDNPCTFTLAGAFGTPPIIKTSPVRFGTASLQIGYASYFTPNASPSKLQDLVVGDFTFEVFLASSGGTPTSPLIYKQNSFSFDLQSSVLRFSSLNASNVATIIISTPLTLTATFKHTALTRQGSTYRLFIDGTLVNTVTSSTVFTSSAISTVFGDVNGAANPVYQMDELRLTKGLALYTANFTPPTAAFTS